MKSVNFFILITIISFFYMCFSYYYSPRKPDYFNSKTYDIRQETANIINAKYGTKTAGFGPAMGNYGIVNMDLTFSADKKNDKNEIRRIIIDSVDTYLNKINSDKSIRPYLVEYPFPTNRIDVTIFFYNSDHSIPSYPDFKAVSLIKDVIYYNTDKDHGIYSHTAVETIEEARRLINEK